MPRLYVGSVGDVVPESPHPSLARPLDQGPLGSPRPSPSPRWCVFGRVPLPDWEAPGAWERVATLVTSPHFRGRHNSWGEKGESIRAHGTTRENRSRAIIFYVSADSPVNRSFSKMIRA